jgi:hypothetical protein
MMELTDEQRAVSGDIMSLNLYLCFIIKVIIFSVFSRNLVWTVIRELLFAE